MPLTGLGAGSLTAPAAEAFRQMVEAAKADDCVGCGLCAMTCPDAVISVFREEEGGGAA